MATSLGVVLGLEPLLWNSWAAFVPLWERGRLPGRIPLAPQHCLLPCGAFSLANGMGGEALDPSRKGTCLNSLRVHWNPFLYFFFWWSLKNSLGLPRKRVTTEDCRSCDRHLLRMKEVVLLPLVQLLSLVRSASLRPGFLALHRLPALGRQASQDLFPGTLATDLEVT